MQRRVAITGLGAVTPVGNDVASTWESLVAGRSGVGRITTFPPDRFPIRIAGMVKGFDLARYFSDRRLVRHLSRVAGFEIGATCEALADAGVTAESYAPHE